LPDGVADGWPMQRPDWVTNRRRCVITSEFRDRHSHNWAL
jgi:hypothetical protein